MRSSIFAIALLPGCVLAQSQWSLKTEVGAAQVSRNDQRIPGDGGTGFSMNDLTGSGPFTFTRLELTYAKSATEEWRLLYSPLRISGTGSLSSPTLFQDATFATGPMAGVYQFNSYRLTYRRPWSSSPKTQWKFGYTLKVRDAEVTLKQGSLQRSELDPRGIVPLLHLWGRQELGQDWFATIDIDGLAGGPGRAFDVGIQFNRPLSPRQDIYLGLRTLEGGADVPRVYSFALVNYISLGITTRF